VRRSPSQTLYDAPLPSYRETIAEAGRDLKENSRGGAFVHYVGLTQPGSISGTVTHAPQRSRSQGDQLLACTLEEILVLLHYIAQRHTIEDIGNDSDIL
jgi:hypothetical protein